MKIFSSHQNSDLNLLIDILDVGDADANIDSGSVFARQWWWHQELLVPGIHPSLQEEQNLLDCKNVQEYNELCKKGNISKKSSNMNQPFYSRSHLTCQDSRF